MMFETTQKKRITLNREQKILLAERVKAHSEEIIRDCPTYADVARTISKEMGCDVSKHAVRETFLVLNKDFSYPVRLVFQGDL